MDKGSAGNDAPYPDAALVEPHFNRQSSYHLCEMWATLCNEPKPQKVMDGLKHRSSIFIDPNLDATLRVGKTAQ
jgi:hypothetical protein